MKKSIKALLIAAASISLLTCSASFVSTFLLTKHLRTAACAEKDSENCAPLFRAAGITPNYGLFTSSIAISRPQFGDKSTSHFCESSGDLTLTFSPFSGRYTIRHEAPITAEKATINGSFSFKGKLPLSTYPKLFTLKSVEDVDAILRENQELALNIHDLVIGYAEFNAMFSLEDLSLTYSGTAYDIESGLYVGEGRFSTENFSVPLLDVLGFAPVNELFRDGKSTGALLIKAKEPISFETMPNSFASIHFKSTYTSPLMDAQGNSTSSFNLNSIGFLESTAEGEVNYAIHDKKSLEAVLQPILQKDQRLSSLNLHGALLPSEETLKNFTVKYNISTKEACEACQGTALLNDVTVLTDKPIFSFSVIPTETANGTKNTITFTMHDTTSFISDMTRYARTLQTSLAKDGITASFIAPVAAPQFEEHLATFLSKLSAKEEEGASTTIVVEMAENETVINQRPLFEVIAILHECLPELTEK